MIDDDELEHWFCQEVLPRERALMRYVRRNCRDPEEAVDVRQDVYVRALNGARRGLPDEPLFYLLTIARNILINRARRAKIVSFELVADVESLNWDDMAYSSERQLDARDDLRRAQAGLDQLPPRCRDVVRLRRVEGLSTNEVADQLGVSTHTVERQLTLGMRALVDFMLGGSGRIVRWDGKRRKISS